MPGQRPNADDIVELASREGTFAVSHRPGDEAGWLELLFNGLTFDLTGLAPGPAAVAPGIAHRYGFASDEPGGEGEALALAPGPHLAGGRAMLPVVRGALALTLALIKSPAIGAVCWHPAQSAIAPGHFARAVSGWLGGGPFPALGLTSLYSGPDTSLRSEGLRFFTGQELFLERSQGAGAHDAKLALRLIDRLIVHGKVTEPVTWDLAGAQVRLEPGSGNIVKAWRPTV